MDDFRWDVYTTPIRWGLLYMEMCDMIDYGNSDEFAGINFTAKIDNL